MLVYPQSLCHTLLMAFSINGLQLRNGVGIAVVSERLDPVEVRVRALQRMGSRFENVNGHERSCTLAGQHRSGLCTCTNNRNANSNDNASARSIISRIVLLAEALFEVLDEIHQQSVVLSSRPSASSIGSIPAPNEIVDSLPVKSYSKLLKHETEEVALRYICLVEYEEGDRTRILPCLHEAEGDSKGMPALSGGYLQI